MRGAIALGVLFALACGCGPRCPAKGSVRDDLPATASSGAFTVTLAATRVPQANDMPGALLLKWSGQAEAAPELTLTDADDVVIAHPSVRGPRVDGFTAIRLQDTRGLALPAGLYGITAVSGTSTATVRFEIVHCTLYY